MKSLTLGIGIDGKPLVHFYLGMGRERRDFLPRESTFPQFFAPVSLLALVDTGASRTLVEQKYLEGLGLSPIGEIDVYTLSNGPTPTKCLTDFVELSLNEEVPGTLKDNLLVVAVADLMGAFGVQILLGRDVIGGLLLTYDGPKRELRLEFSGEPGGV